MAALNYPYGVRGPSRGPVGGIAGGMAGVIGALAPMAHLAHNQSY
jgi:hypothetical protein